MKKRMWALGIVFLAFAAGCSLEETDETQEEQVMELPESEAELPEIEEYEVELSENLYDFQFALNGKVWNLPSPLADWQKDGWESSDAIEDTEL